jgi:hypothetical protein
VHSAGARLLIAFWIALSAAPIGLVPGPPKQKPDAQEPFTIGVLRRDGVITPFATFDGRNWTAPWPGGLRFVDVPISLEAVPLKWWGKAGPPEQMTLWTAGEKRGIVRLDRPATVRIMCSPRLGLRSDYVSSLPVPPPTEPSYPKEGLVVSGTTRVESIPTVPSSSPEWTASALILAKPFDDAEAKAVGAFTDWKHPMSRDERRKVPILMEALYKAPMDEPGWIAYRFQAIKRYPARPADGDCGPISSASGWIAVGPDGKPWTELTVRVTYCDRMDDLFTLPLGLIRARGRAYWIYQLSGYDREGYAVTRPTPKAIETDIQYAAGTCPR